MRGPLRCAEVPAHLGRARELLEPALSYTEGTVDLEDLLVEALHGHAVLWLGRESALASRIVRVADGYEGHIILAAGDGDELVEEILPGVEAWYRNLGCSRMTLSGRKGWARRLAHLGYRRSEIITLERSL